MQIATDWSQSPPVQLWRRPIGPGWSSFAVSGNLLYTQEQRGGDEIVSCYRMSTGEPVWRHRDATRFWESNGGAGPRGTPTLSNGRVYTFGGDRNPQRARRRHRRRRVVAQRGVRRPRQDPDVGLLELAAGRRRRRHRRGRREARRLRRRDRQAALVRRSAAASATARRISSTIDGVEQVLFISGPGTTSVAPATGKVLWEHAWEGGAIVQPALTADGDVLVNTISMNGGLGMRRLAIAHKSGGWTASERWTSTGLKPYFNDFVVHNGHAYGFDGNILSCIDLQDGTRKWKGGRYGNGQLVLLADQDLLLVLSEEGELALVKATPDQFTEVARFPGARGQDLEPPGGGPRRPAGAQRPRDGRVPAVTRAESLELGSQRVVQRCAPGFCNQFHIH